MNNRNIDAKSLSNSFNTDNRKSLTVTKYMKRYLNR